MIELDNVCISKGLVERLVVNHCVRERVEIDDGDVTQRSQRIFLRIQTVATHYVKPTVEHFVLQVRGFELVGNFCRQRIYAGATKQGLRRQIQSVDSIVGFRLGKRRSFGGIVAARKPVEAVTPSTNHEQLFRSAGNDRGMNSGEA